MSTFTKTVTVEISGQEFVASLVASLYPKAKNSQGKERTLYYAFASLVGCSDVEAVRIANRQADKEGLPRISTAEFRRWIPTVLSETFAEFLEDAK